MRKAETFEEKMEAQKIIITGGATRIGAAIAERLSGFKVQILIHYIKKIAIFQYK